MPKNKLDILPDKEKSLLNKSSEALEWLEPMLASFTEDYFLMKTGYMNESGTASGATNRRQK